MVSSVLILSLTNLILSSALSGIVSRFAAMAVDLAGISLSNKFSSFLQAAKKNSVINNVIDVFMIRLVRLVLIILVVYLNEFLLVDFHHRVFNFKINCRR